MGFSLLVLAYHEYSPILKIEGLRFSKWISYVKPILHENANLAKNGLILDIPFPEWEPI